MYTSLGIMATKIMYHTHISRQSVLEKKKGFQVRCLLPCQRNLAESCQHSRKLKERRGALSHGKVCSTDLLDELQLEELGHAVALANSKHVGDDVLGAVAELPEVGKDLVSLVDVGLRGVVQHVLHQQGVWFVTNLENIFRLYKTKSFMRRLKIVQGLSHIPLGCENNGLQPILGVVDALCLAHSEHFGEHLGVGQLAVPEHGATGLDWLDDLFAGVAGEGEPRGGAVQLHGPPQRLLGGLGHTVRLVQHYDLVPALRQRHLLLGEHLDLVPHSLDATVIGSIQLHDSFFERGTQELPSKAHYSCGFSNSRRAGDDDVWHISIPCKNCQPAHSFLVADNLREGSRAIFFNPGNISTASCFALFSFCRHLAPSGVS